MSLPSDQGPATRRVLRDESGAFTIDARGLSARELNQTIRTRALAGAQEISVRNVVGQRYIGTNLRRKVTVYVHGTPGNDLGAFMDGPSITVLGNAQDGVGNTMNSGEIIVHGRAGDVVAMSMRGGEIFVRGDVGSRCGIHMKEYGDKRPVVVVGGTAHDFLGEYMAGGILLVLGLGLAPGEPHHANFVGTGMHGGRIFVRGTILPWQLGAQVATAEPDQAEQALIRSLVERFCDLFDEEPGAVLRSSFTKLQPTSLRPYGQLYAAGRSNSRSSAFGLQVPSSASITAS